MRLEHRARGLAFAALALCASAAIVAAPRKDPETRAAWAAELAWPRRLCPAAAPRPDSTGVSLKTIDAQRRWIFVECQQWTAQGTQLVYLDSTQGRTLLQFRQFDASREGLLRPYRSALLQGDVDADPARALLRVLRPYRGIGDCGQWLTYEAGTNPPRLVELRIRECPDLPGPELPPEQWPLRKP